MGPGAAPDDGASLLLGTDPDCDRRAAKPQNNRFSVFGRRMAFVGAEAARSAPLAGLDDRPRAFAA
jgi:hypothetical protein